MALKLQETKGMVFHEPQHYSVAEAILDILNPEFKFETGEIVCGDFDSVEYKLNIYSDKKNLIEFRLSMPFLRSVWSAGSSSAVTQNLLSCLSITGVKDDELTLSVDLRKAKTQAQELATSLSLLKYKLLSGPLERAFGSLLEGGQIHPDVVIPFPNGDHQIIHAEADRVLVVYSIHFSERADRAIARVFMSEFWELQRKLPRSPSVTYTPDPPQSVARATKFTRDESLVGFISFQIFKDHLKGEKSAVAVNLLTQFRSYILYHVKASKSHLHARMRARCTNLEKVLNRADPKKGEATGASRFKHR